MAEVLAIVNQKGGVGKTTTSVNVAGYLAEAGKSALVIDMDPQANATAGLGKRVTDPATPTVYDVLLESKTPSEALQSTSNSNLHLIPSTPDLIGAAIELMDQPHREYRLRRALKDVDEHFDFILLDCPPSLGLLTVNALAAAQKVLIPVQCEFYALEGLNQLLKTVEMVREHLNPNIQVLGALLTMYDRRTALARKVVKDVRRTFPGHVFDSVIPRNTELAEAPASGQTILEYAKDSLGARAYEYLSEELLNLYV